MAFINHKERRGSTGRLSLVIKMFYATIVIIMIYSICVLLDNVRPDQIKNISLNASSLAPPIDIGRKEGTHVILNIGSNLDPIVPRPNDNPCTIALAFEPIVGHLIRDHPALHVVPAAVSPESGWATMNLYNKDGRSSSLSKASYGAYWNKNSKLKVVPLISFKNILDSLRNYKIDLILTDMQGHDFASVSSVGGYLAETGVKRLITEVYKDNISSYKGANNDLCKDWLPHMTSIGYVFEGLTEMVGDEKTLIEGYRNNKEIVETCKKSLLENTVEKTGLNEYNAFWRLKSEPTVGMGIDIYQYGTHSSKKPGYKFAKEDYTKCN
jgi:hypothetical protein